MTDTQENSAVYAIIGAAGGIGSTLCRILSSRGAELMLGGRNAEPLEQLASELNAKHRVVDATSFEEVEQFVQQTVEAFGRIDGIVNCAGSILLKPAHLTTYEDWELTISLNLTSAFAVVRAATPAMSKTGGSIVLISSAAAQHGLRNHEAIAAAKAGVVGLIRSAAATYASRGIRVNCVSPGLIDTPLASRITSNENALKVSKSMHALGRIGKPDDVAEAIAWLLNPRHDWVTGQVIGVDGGLASVRAG